MSYLERNLDPTDEMSYEPGFLGKDAGKNEKEEVSRLVEGKV